MTTVTSITPRGPPEPVYNLEVQVKHTYHVADSGVLVHNGENCNLYTASADENFNQNLLRLGVHEHLDEFGSALSKRGVDAAPFGSIKFFEIAENNGPQITGFAGSAGEWKYITEAIKNRDEIYF